MSLEVKIRDVETGQWLELPFQFREFHEYEVVTDADSVLWAGVSLENQGVWPLFTTFVVGYSILEVGRGTESIHYQIEVLPDQRKVDSREQWRTMLLDIAQWGHYTLGYTGIRFGGLLFKGLGHSLCVEAVSTLFWEFVALVQSVDAWIPRTERSTPVLLSRAHPDQVYSVASDPSVQRWILGKQDKAQELDVNTLDIDVHAMQSLSASIQRVLTAVANTIEQLEKGDSLWRQSRASNFRKGVGHIHSAISRHNLSRFYSMERDLSRSIDATYSPVLQRVFRLTEQLTSPMFDVLAKEFPVSQTHSYTVYEIWCFRQLVQLLTEILGSNPRWKGGSSHSLQGSTVTWDSDRGPVRLMYNHRFRAYWEMKEDAPFSLIGEQRPDFVLTVQNRWLVLDAKYRTTRENVLDAFNSAFSYLQSLKIPSLASEPMACLLLVPKVLSESKIWFGERFHRENNFGLLCCAPERSTEHLKKTLYTVLVVE